MSTRTTHDFARRMRMTILRPLVEFEERVAKSTDVYRTIEQRLRTSFRPPILLEHCIEPGSLRVEPSVLGGIFFTPKNFQGILQAFREAHNEQGEDAFDHHAFTPQLLKHLVINLVHLDLLDISYLVTNGHGFREIRNPIQLDDRLPSLQDARPNRFGVGWDKRFGGRFGYEGTGERRIDLTSIHAAISDDVCNIHIDEMGFVLRFAGAGAMSLDAGEHLVDELGWKTYARPAISKWLGENDFTHLKWAIDRLSIELPSSRNGYAPNFGLRLDAPEENLSISLTVSLKCKCLPAGSSQVDDAYSIGIGVTKHFGGPSPRPKRH